MIDQTDKDLYWDIVKECLEAIYGLDPDEAVTRSGKLRDEVHAAASSQVSDLFYHAEPIDVAGDLANRRKELSEMDWKKYDRILERKQW